MLLRIVGEQNVRCNLRYPLAHRETLSTYGRHLPGDQSDHLL